MKSIVQAVNCQPISATAQIRDRVGICGLCGGQSSTGTGLFRVDLFF